VDHAVTIRTEYDQVARRIRDSGALFIIAKRGEVMYFDKSVAPFAVYVAEVEAADNARRTVNPNGIVPQSRISFNA
jgi:hypothetical protein